MSGSKISCLHCKAQFYSSAAQPKCGVCDKAFCPNCNACECTNFKVQITKKNQSIGLKDIITIKENQLIEISATLSPLKGQTPVTTKNGNVLKTEFELSDDHQKIPLIIWGPVPEKLFPYRYEYTNFVFSGLKKKVFNGKPVLVASRTTKYYVNNLKMKPLDYFLSQSAY